MAVQLLFVVSISKMDRTKIFSILETVVQKYVECTFHTIKTGQFILCTSIAQLTISLYFCQGNKQNTIKK